MADIEIAGVPNHELAEWIKDNCEFRQLILEFYTQAYLILVGFMCHTITKRI